MIINHLVDGLGGLIRYGATPAAVGSWCSRRTTPVLIDDHGALTGSELWSAVITTAQRRQFDRQGLADWIDSQAAMAYEVAMDASQRATFRERIERRLDEMRRADGSYDLTYVRLEASARKPG